MTVLPDVTVTPQPTHDFRDDRTAEVIIQFTDWEKELGREQAVQKTVDWLNGELQTPAIPEGIKGAFATCNNTFIWIDFEDGRSTTLNVRDPLSEGCPPPRG